APQLAPARRDGADRAFRSQLRPAQSPVRAPAVPDLILRPMFRGRVFSIALLCALTVAESAHAQNEPAAIARARQLPIEDARAFCQFVQATAASDSALLIAPT